jgi:hypothetical protein
MLKISESEVWPKQKHDERALLSESWDVTPELASLESRQHNHNSCKSKAARFCSKRGQKKWWWVPCDTEPKNILVPTFADMGTGQEWGSSEATNLFHVKYQTIPESQSDLNVWNVCLRWMLRDLLRREQSAHTTVEHIPTGIDHCGRSSQKPS